MLSSENRIIPANPQTKLEQTKQPVVEAADCGKPEKSFNQHLDDEIRKESKVDSPDKSLPAEQRTEDKHPEDTSVLLTMNDVLEEKDLRISGKGLPEADAGEVSFASLSPVKISETNSTNKNIENTWPLRIISDEVNAETTDTEVSEAEIPVDDLELGFNEENIVVPSDKKMFAETQLQSKQPLIAEDVSKTIKTAQSATLTPAVMVESAKVPVENIAEQIHIATPVSQKQWATEFSQRLTLMINNGQQQVAEIRLNPAQLGPLSVRLHMDEDQANISFVANNQVVKEAIEVSLPRLKEQLQEQGLDLGDVDVSTKDHDELAQDTEQYKNMRDNGSNEEENLSLESSVVVEKQDGVSIFI